MVAPSGYLAVAPTRKQTTMISDLLRVGNSLSSWNWNNVPLPWPHMGSVVKRVQSAHRRTCSFTTLPANRHIYWWAMLGSNQRPLSCEGEASSFATIRRYPLSAFLSWMTRYPHRGYSLLFAPVVVKLSSDHGLPTTPALQRLLDTCHYFMPR